MRKASSRLETMAFRRAGVDLFRELVGRIPREAVLQGKGSRGTWLIFMEKVQEHKEGLPVVQENEQVWKEASLAEQGAPGWTQMQKGSVWEVERDRHSSKITGAGPGHAGMELGKPKKKLRWSWNKWEMWRSARKTSVDTLAAKNVEESCWPAAEWGDTGHGKDCLLHAFFALVFYWQCLLSTSQVPNLVAESEMLHSLPLHPGRFSWGPYK